MRPYLQHSSAWPWRLGPQLVLHNPLIHSSNLLTLKLWALLVLDREQYTQVFLAHTWHTAHALQIVAEWMAYWQGPCLCGGGERTIKRRGTINKGIHRAIQIIWQEWQRCPAHTCHLAQVNSLFGHSGHITGVSVHSVSVHSGHTTSLIPGWAGLAFCPENHRPGPQTTCSVPVAWVWVRECEVLPQAPGACPWQAGDQEWAVLVFTGQHPCQHLSLPPAPGATLCTYTGLLGSLFCIWSSCQMPKSWI